MRYSSRKESINLISLFQSVFHDSMFRGACCGEVLEPYHCLLSHLNIAIA